MEAILYFGLIILVFALIAAIPIAITYFLYRFLKRKFPNKAYKYLAFIPTLLLVYSVWTSLFPTEEFYEADYKEVMKLDIPSDARIIDKTATFPDNFGDYTSVFVIEMNANEFQKIETQLLNLKFSEMQKDNHYSPETSQTLARVKHNISKHYNYTAQSGKDYYVALFDDGKTILVRRTSW